MNRTIDYFVTVLIIGKKYFSIQACRDFFNPYRNQKNREKKCVSMCIFDDEVGEKAQ